jgi:uncharacterized protein YndB with AHSA1/START domain
VNTQTTQNAEPRLVAAQRRTIQAAQELVWEFLTKPELISDWFADCEKFAPASEFKFDFGDGDFFAGRVVSWIAPSHLELEWRFDSIGVESAVTYDLAAHGESCTVTVQDCGATSENSASELAEGWDDFLARLQRRVETGQRSRYRWSQSIGLGSRTAARDSQLLETLQTGEWWRKSFPNASCQVASSESNRVIVEFRDPSFGADATTAKVGLRQFAGSCHIGVDHSGWDKLELPVEQQIHLRRTYCRLWIDALKRFETTYPFAQ